MTLTATQSCIPVLSKLSFDASVYKLLFISGDTFISGLMYFFLLAAGMCTAFFQFGFLVNRAKLNIIMSFGLKRNQLFANRLLSSTAALLLAVFVPFTVTFFANARYIGITDYLIKTYLLYVLSFFTVLLIGFAVTVLACALCATVLESSLLGIGIISFPYVLIQFFNICFSIFLKGYCYSLDTKNPVYLLSGSIWYDRGNILSKSFTENPEYAKAVTTFLPRDFLLFIAWIFICLFILLIARRLFIKRRAEICGLYKSSKPASFILSSFAVISFADISMLLAREIDGFQIISANLPLCSFILLIIFTVIACIISVFVFSTGRRNLTVLLKRSSLLLLLYVVPICCLFGGFGFSSRIPSSADVDKIVISFPYTVDVSGSAIFYVLSGFETDSEKAIVTDIHSLLVKSESSKSNSHSILVAYNLKNKKQIFREYKGIADDILLETTKLYDCKTVKDYIYSQIADKSSWGSEYSYPQLYRERLFDSSFQLRDIDWLHLNNINVSLRPCNNFANTDITAKLTPESFEKLLDVLAEDLSNLSSKDFYTPDEPPLGAISLFQMSGSTSLSFTYESDSSIHNLYVYPSMKNTISYLKSLSVYDAFSKKTEIIEIALFDCEYDDFFVQNTSRLENFKIYNDYINRFYEQLKINDTVPYKTLNQKEDIALAENNLFPYYLTVNQDVSFARVTYADQSFAFFIIKN